MCASLTMASHQWQSTDSTLKFTVRFNWISMKLWWPSKHFHSSTKGAYQWSMGRRRLRIISAVHLLGELLSNHRKNEEILSFSR
jgi:hypothetical protein